ncbi:MAG: glycosyltransferase family 39 protein, partial [Nitrospirota bacterium]|nr:glycosyltransferase family 39 protein [Nitrospirota bacterium]
MVKTKTLLVLGAVITLYLSFLSLFGELGVDGGGYLTISQGILRGQLPYLDFIDHKPPGIYYIFALFLSIWNSIWMIKISLIVINLSTAFVIYLIATKLWNEYTGVIAGLFYLTGLIIYNGHMVLTEPFMAFFISLSLLGYVLFHQSKEPKYLFFTGMMIGIAAIIKQPVVFLIIGLMLCMNLKIQTRNLKNNIYLLSGVSIPIIITITYFYLNGVVDDLIFNIFYLNTGFYKVSGVAEFFYYNLLENFYLFPLLWALAIYGMATATRHWRPTNPLLMISILMIVSFAPVMTGHGASYYIGILPFASLLAAYVSGCSLSVIGKNQKTFA